MGHKFFLHCIKSNRRCNITAKTIPIDLGHIYLHLTKTINKISFARQLICGFIDYSQLASEWVSAAKPVNLTYPAIKICRMISRFVFLSPGRSSPRKIPLCWCRRNCTVKAFFLGLTPSFWLSFFHGQQKLENLTGRPLV